MAQRPVVEHHLDRVEPGGEVAAGVGDDLGVHIDRGDLSLGADQVREQRGGVAGSRADLQH